MVFAVMIPKLFTRPCRRRAVYTTDGLTLGCPGKFVLKMPSLTSTYLKDGTDLAPRITVVPFSQQKKK